jgi:hypothetical protein
MDVEKVAVGVARLQDDSHLLLKKLNRGEANGKKKRALFQKSAYPYPDKVLRIVTTQEET